MVAAAAVKLKSTVAPSRRHRAQNDRRLDLYAVLLFDGLFAVRIRTEWPWDPIWGHTLIISLPEVQYPAKPKEYRPIS
eukprot:22666-Lingulodinium_polyedra.AAC.1